MEQRQRTQQEREPYKAFPPRIRIRPEHSALARRGRAGKAPDHTDNQHQETEGVYVISVAARLLEMHPQTLRKYERLGLVQPARTIGMLRLYSDEDLYRLRLIRHLEETLGLNLAGVEWALSLVRQLLEMHRRLSQLEEVGRLRRALQQEMSQLFAALNLPLDGEPQDQRQD